VRHNDFGVWLINSTRPEVDMTTEATTTKENPVLGAFDAGSNEGAKPDGNGADASATADAGKPAPADAEQRQSAADSGGKSGGDAGGEGAADASVKPEAKQDLVQQAAFTEAQSEIKELRKKISELESRPALSKEQQAALDKLKETEQATKEAEPDFLADPKGYVDAKVKAALDKLEGSEKQTKEEAEKIKQQQALTNLLSATARAEASFTETTPDYHKALTHVREIRKQQLKMLYPDATDQQVGQQLASEEIAIAHQALTRNQNPAEFIYNLSKTYGYKPPEKEKPAEQQAQQKQQQNAQAKKPADKDAARSMGSGGGDLPDNDDPGPNTPELAVALAERFKKRA
jgi:hypothetical protein